MESEGQQGGDLILGESTVFMNRETKIYRRGEKEEEDEVRLDESSQVREVTDFPSFCATSWLFLPEK